MALVPFAIPKFLNNGAEILAYKKRLRGVMIVLARWVRHDGAGQREEYVTWAVDDNGDAYWGHYFNNEDDALVDWEKR